MRNPFRRIGVVAVVWACAAVAASAAEAPLAPIGSLADAGPNQWVRIAHSPTGWREQPVFVYAPPLKRFVMAAGLQSSGGTGPRHYDAEEFDLATARWANAYPPAVAAGRPEAGPVGEEYSKAREKIGWSGFEMFYKDAGLLRVAAGGQWTENRAGYEFCYCPDDQKVYVSLHAKTLRYDPAARTWEDLAAKPRTTCVIWGAMAYDPVNKEILHAGGDGGEAEVGTWAYSIEKNEWRRLEFGSPELKDVHGFAKQLRLRAKALLGAACNRFALSETPAEAHEDLLEQARTLATSARALAGAARKLNLPPNERGAGAIGSKRSEAAAEALRAVGPKLAGRLTPDVLNELRAARVIFEQIVDALAPEPGGRARSQIAYDPRKKVIVLFGGDRLDRVLSDTWVYDCAARTWSQRFPDVCPTPRAGHVFAAMPKSPGLLVLAGGYSRTWLPQEIWTFETAGDRWLMRANVPLAKPDNEGRRFSPAAPRTTARLTQVGAVNEDNVLVCASSEDKGLATWACKLDVSKHLIIPEGQAGASGAYTFNTIAPQTWEKLAGELDAARQAKVYADLPANTWTALSFPKYAPGAQNRWGTTAYDTARHQMMFWGGGHSTSHENDVSHFTVRGGFWTVGYHPDDAIEIVYASQPTPISFADRPHVPVHAYKTYCYDPAADRLLYLDRAYDPAAREWEAKPYPGLESAGVMHTQLKPTPLGAVAFSKKGLFRLDAKTRTWAKLPWDGPRPEGIWCDGEGLVYDAKRDCLWFGMKNDVYRYEMKTGKAEKVPVTKPKALGEFTFWGEQVYLPGADLILTMNLHRRPDGRWANVAYDPAAGKFLWLDLSFVEGGKPAALKNAGDGGKPFSWSDALAYDPELNLVLMNNSSARKVWALRVDRATLKVEDMGE